MFLDIWHSQSNINWDIPSKVFLNREEINKNDYRDIALQNRDEIELIYGILNVGPMSYNCYF